MRIGKMSALGDHRRARCEEACVRREALQASPSSSHFYGNPRPPGAQPSLFPL